ncbi:MAG: hypothetical protein ACLU37_00045 [Collinsella sp.]
MGRAPQRHGRRRRTARARPQRIYRSSQLDWGLRYRPFPAGDELARGIFQTVDDFGRACIETEDGLRSFHFEEASLRPMGK